MPTEHVTIGHAECHEPRHISVSSGVDAGKVITPSSSVAGTSVLRFLEGDEIASSNGPQGYTLVSNGDGTTSWVQNSAIYGYSHDTVNTGSIDINEPVPVNITHQSSNNQAGGNWGNGANFLTIPQDGVYKLHFSASMNCSEAGTLYALASDVLPTDDLMFNATNTNANDSVNVSGVIVGNYSSGTQIRLYVYFAPDGATTPPVVTSTGVRSLYVEKIG